MGAQIIAFPGKMRTTQGIRPSESLLPEQRRDDNGSRSRWLRTAHFLRLSPPKRLLKRAT
jgi:hypothetical protein